MVKDKTGVYELCFDLFPLEGKIKTNGEPNMELIA